MKVRPFFAAALLFCPLTALAQNIVVNVDPTIAEQAGIDANAVEQDMGTAIDGNLKLGDQDAFMHQMANAALFSIKGMGVDYATNPQRFMFGGSFGTAVNSSGAGFGKGDGLLPSGGYAAQVALMAGLNLGAFSDKDSPMRRFVLYANGMSLTLPSGASSFEGDFLNYGVHLQYKLVKRVNMTAVEWGGIDFTTGYEHMKYALSLSKDIPIDSDSVTWTATGSYLISASGSAIPLELSTNLRLVFLTLYAGGGTDLAVASRGDSEIGLNGPLTVDLQGQEASLGDASVTWTGTGKADFLAPRAFAGAQVNVFLLKVYGQVNVGTGGNFGGNFGARLSF